MNKNTKTWSRSRLVKYSLFTMILLLLLLEVIGRILFMIKFNQLETSVYIQGSPLLVADSSTVYNNRPFYVDYKKKFQYNEAGMKVKPAEFFMPVKQANEIWVLLLGASAMEGMGSNKNGDWFDITNVADHPYNETIAAFLQSTLNKKYPGKKVQVFNAGVSAYTLSQSIKRYDKLSHQYDFDWVISMDGVNEPTALEEQENIHWYNEQQWLSQPFHRYPLNWIIPVTQHAAFFNLLKQEFYYLKQNARISFNQQKGFPKRSYWIKQFTDTNAGTAAESATRQASLVFLSALRSFSQRLDKDKVNYLLLVQPHLAFRNPNRLTAEEKALNNYYRKEHNDLQKYSFLKMAYDTVDSWSMGSYRVQTMNGVNEWQGWTFVDYCHFTREANKKIAAELANFIIADGKLRIFKHQSS